MWPARGNFLEATAELIECRTRVTHQVLAGRREPHGSRAALEQNGPKRALQLADRVTDGTWCQVKLIRRIAKRSGAGGSFKGAN